MALDLCSLILKSRKTYEKENPILFDDQSNINLEDISKSLIVFKKSE